ncbi:TetR/AcrR family transcriptional regulator [Nocardia sp. alder85J]|uniref:TetR/AcrR family transcriptional regulator n=1 Tax=Nocardia sp. alder85J TaxID=2862949 RepID=UPI001CD5D60F|nr:TetR/AcrR family transcriptional regulator [Nocardia sp. alder85J]MCX4091746.1 helix-turn-helix domain containing protein [Nocardia sp. alder85J]
MNDHILRADARDNRAKILTAARSAFDALGPQANLREIARRADVAQGTVHRHFPTKQALFSAIITERLRELTQLARQLRAEHDADTAFITFLTTTVEQARHNRSLASVFEEADGGEDMQTAGREMNAELALLLDRAQAEGTIRDDIDLADVHAIAAAVLAVDTHPAAHPADRAKRVAIVLDGLRPPGRRA